MPSSNQKVFTMVGEAADHNLHRAQVVIRSEGLNPEVTYEFSALDDGILCGINEVKDLLSKVLPESARDVWMIDQEGHEISIGDVVVRVTSRYANLILHETAISGVLSSYSGWATAAHKCVVAAGEKKIASWGARYIHPNTVGAMEYASIKAGCYTTGTMLGGRLTGADPVTSIPDTFILISGASTSAFELFNKSLGPEVPKYAKVGVVNDEAEEALALANEFGGDLRGIHIDVPLSHGGNTPELVKEVYKRLELGGHKDLDIIVSGSMDPEKISQFEEKQTPVTIYGVGKFIACAKPLPFKVILKNVDGQPVAPRGYIPGIEDSPKLVRVM